MRKRSRLLLTAKALRIKGDCKEIRDRNISHYVCAFAPLRFKISASVAFVVSAPNPGVNPRGRQ